MENEYLVTTVAFIVTGFLFIGMAIPLIHRKIPPNSFYGFRVAETLADKKLWYDVNEYSARLLRNFGIHILAAVPLLLQMDITPAMYTMILTGFTLIGTIVLIILSFRYLRSVKKR